MAEKKKREPKLEKTFSQDVKEEIASSLVDLNKEEFTLFLAGFIQQTGSLVFIDGKMGLDVQTGNAIVARRIFQALRKNYEDIRIEIAIRKMVKLNKQTMYVLRIADDSKTFLNDIYFFNDTGFVGNIPEPCKKEPKLMSHYLQGLFLGAGSVNNLNLENYHLEIRLDKEHLLDEIIEEMNQYQIELKKVKRRNHYILYLKSSSMIGDFIAFMQATNSRFAFEDVRISRDMMNSMNRLINMELANEQKTQKATAQQVENIQYVIKKLGRNFFSEKEQQVIDARFLYQDASLVELTEILFDENRIQISKSGLNHIFRKINKKAEELRETEKKK